jgi:hypothetical protein
MLLVTLAHPAAHARLPEAAMRLPAELSSAERLPVEGRQGWKLLEQLRFGDVLVHRVERSLTKGDDVKVLFFRGSKRRQTFGCAVSERGQPGWQVLAATDLRRRAFDGDFTFELRNESGFSALLVPAGEGGAEWTLDLREKGEMPLAGTLRGAGERIEVRGTNKLAGTPLRLGETAGYVFERGGRALAAVEVINRGAVWLSPDLDPALRPAIVAAVASLLLFEELRPTLPE